MKVKFNFYKIKYTLFSLIIFIAFSSPVFAGTTLIKNFDKGLDDAGIQTGHTSTDVVGNGFFGGAESMQEVVGYVVGLLLSLMGVFFLGLMIYGGYTWMMSRGNEQEAEKAKNTMINAVIGIAIVIGAYAITTFLLNGPLREIYDPYVEEEVI